jgi:hypothetical protein
MTRPRSAFTSFRRDSARAFGAFRAFHSFGNAGTAGFCGRFGTLPKTRSVRRLNVPEL